MWVWLCVKGFTDAVDLVNAHEFGNGVSCFMKSAPSCGQALPLGRVRMVNMLVG